ncbi:MAG: hypothetical protein MUC62_02710 [Candidatus Thermoplasmatota archaeon]|jgi:hypothetical protein|nr:hypothetical protein [Candidatus Thermoplasmatota archaeon]
MRKGKVGVLLTAMFMVLVIVPYGGRDVSAGAPVYSASIRMLDGTDALRTQTPTDICTDQNGRLYVLYRSDQTFFYGAYMTISEDNGRTWGPAKRVDDVLRDGNSSNDMSHKKLVTPRMAVGLDGTVHIVWEDWREWNEEPTMTRPANILHTTTRDGRNFTKPVKVDPVKGYRTWDAMGPDIEVMEDGRLFCVWLDKKDSGAYLNVWSSFSDDSGATWSAPVLINTDGLDLRNHYHPRCAVWGDNVYVTWDDMRDLEKGLSPFIAVSHDRGVSFSPEVLLSDDAEIGNERTDPYPATDDRGTLYIAWNDLRTDAHEVFFVRSDDNGTTFSGNKRLLNTPEGTGDSFACMDAMGDGRILLTWNRSVPIDQAHRESEAYSIISEDGGETWGGMLRVDDTDRFEEDRTDQESVLGIFDNDGRPLCVWADTRPDNPGSAYRDLHFARNSVSLTAPNEMPILLFPAFTGNSGFSNHIGGLQTIYNFTLVYKDEDNDVPGTGYPRVMLYSDAEGTVEALDDWLIMERTRGPADIYFMDGVPFFASLVLSQPGQYYWRMEVSDGIAGHDLATGIFPGPLIDTTPPILTVLGPDEAVWIPTETVRCRVRVVDSGGAGVDPRTILVRKSVNGPGNLQLGVPITGYEMMDNDTYEAWADVKFGIGTENHVAFEAKDRVFNGPTASNMVNVWVDFEAPYYKDVVPDPRNTQIYGNVNCSIVWRDINPGTTNLNTTGVDPGTMMWAYRTTTGAYTDWALPDGIEPLGESSYRAWKWITFPDEGVYNFVKWKASDNIGNEAVTDQLRVNVDIPVNYRPVFKGTARPGLVNSPTPHIWWDSAYDEEDDPLYYSVKLHRMPGKLEITGWFDTGLSTFFDVPDMESLNPGYYLLKINVTDNIGGYDILDHQFRVVDSGPAPPSMVGRFGPFNTTTTNITLNWPPASGDDGSAITYLVRIGLKRTDGRVLDWTSTGEGTSYDLSGTELPLGAYTVGVMAFQNGNYSRVRTTLLKLSDYSVRIDAPSDHQVYRGKGVTKSKPLKVEIVNLGSLEDNVTLHLEGELIEKGWAYLEVSGRPVATYRVEPSKGLAHERPIELSVVITPPENAPRKDYVLTIRAVSEDGTTTYLSQGIRVKVQEAPSDDGPAPLTDDIIGFLTSILPFLGILPDRLVIPAFFLLIVLLIIAPITIALLLLKRKREREKAKDPMAERKVLYRELYGKEASVEELKQWEEEKGAAEASKERPEPATDKEGKAPSDAQKGTAGASKEAEKKAPEKAAIENLDKDDKELLDRLFD